MTRTGWARTDRQGGLRVRAGAAVVVVLLGVSACSGPDADAAQGTPTPSVGPAAQGTATQGTATPGATDPAGTPSVTPTSPAPSEPTSGTTSGVSDPGATVAPVDRDRAEPVALDEVAAPEKGVTAKVAKIEKVSGESVLPGEVAGPGLRLTVVVHNGTDEALDLRGAVLNLYLGKDRTPATALLEPGGVPFPAELAAGADSTGVFVFRVPTKSRDHLEVELDLTPTSTVVVFTGGA